MKRILFLRESSPALKFLFLIGMMLLFALLFGLLGLVIGKFWLHTDLMTLSGFITDPPNEKARAFVYFYQFFNQLGVFFIPALLLLLFVSNDMGQYLCIKMPPKGISVLLAISVVYVILPFVNYLTEINAGFHLPQALSKVEEWMKSSENQADHVTKMFLSVRSGGGLMLNLFIVAFIPALGEELLFRGLVQRLLAEWTKNVHYGVILAALLFSAMHMQFYGFLPRFALGLVLGYLFVISGNLWLPIIAHFVNNASSVLIYYLHYNGFIKVKMEDFGATPNVFYIAGSFLMTLWLFSILYQKEGASIRFFKFKR